MNGRRTEASTHAVLIIDADKRLIEEHPAVPAGDVAPLIANLQARHGSHVRVIVDGVTLDTQMRASVQAAASRPPMKAPVEFIEDNQEGPLLGVEVAHAMLWDSFVRAR